ncbi:MAG: ATP-binding cassette domain-containing protein [Gemmatimonadota bacterium]
MYTSGTAPALTEITLSVERGETLVLLGSSGSGKTTALKLVNRLVEPTTGEVHIGGEDVRSIDVHRLRRSIGYVFQGIGLFPHLTVAENVAVVPSLEGWEAGRTRRRVDDLLDMVGLPPDRFRRRYPDALSGGQAQRVGVARALAADPEILLMDEPFGALDAVTRVRLQGELVDLAKRLERTIVFVTHDLIEALKLGDRIAVLHRGALHQIGTGRDLHDRPATPFVRDLLGQLRDQIDEADRLLGGAA